ncbi:KRFB protein, partial [Serilophus lunatus]|nr:KRFB protein [Serilophus lunatus]
CPEPIAWSFSEPCVQQCPESRALLFPPPVVLTMPGPILSSCPQQSEVDSARPAWLEPSCPSPSSQGLRGSSG